MFLVVYESANFSRWDSEYIFENYEEAKLYLIEDGFYQENYLFFRSKDNWGDKLKAYIEPRKKFKRNDK